MSFVELLKCSAEGDERSLETMLEMYKPLLLKMSMINGVIDDDLQQEQIICFWKCVKTFYKKYKETCNEKE